MDNLFHKRRKAKDLFIVSGLVLLLVGLVALAVAVMFSDDTVSYWQRLLGLRERSEKYDVYGVLKTIGFCVAGVLLVWQAWAANKRAKAMEDATENTEAGQRQERLKNAIEHLGHDRDSVRMGGAYELFHLAKDTRDLRQTVFDILCAHIRQTTSENKYEEKYGTKPSEEIQGMLTLLFTQKHDVFQDCSIINLQGNYLNGANLRQARLKRANLRQVQLQNVDLSKAQLQGADLIEARLQKTFLWEAQLQWADLSNAQLQEATLWDAQLQRADLSGAELQGTDLSGAKLQGADLSEAKLQGADLSGAELQGTDLSGAELQGANLSGAELQEADLSDARLQGANLFRAQMQRVDLSKAQLQGADLSEAQMQRADLSETQLQGANLMKTQLQRAELMKAQLQGVSSQEADHLPSAGFESRIRNRIGEPSELTGIIFSGGLKQEDLGTLCEGLSAEKAQALREKLRSHVGQPISNELPPDSGAKIGTYTQEEAEQWITEYNDAMRKAPSTGDTANTDSAPDSGKDKGD